MSFELIAVEESKTKSIKSDMHFSSAASTIMTFQGKQLVMDNQKNLYLVDQENSDVPLICRKGVLNPDMLVLKENLLINIPLSYSEREQKIIAFTVSQIKDSDTNFFPVVLSTQLIAEFLNVKKKNMYHDIRNIQASLRRATPLPWISNNKIAISSFPFFSYVASNEALNVFLINERLSSFLLSLQTNAGKLIADDHKLSYTKLPLIVFGKLHGKYTLRLYEILSKNVYKKIIRINIFDLFKMLNIEGSYCNYKLFNRDILRVAHLEINDKSNLTFSYEMCKVGKSVTSITFHISNKNILKAIKQVKDELISIGITIIGINDIFENRHVSHEIVRRNLDYVRDKLCRNNNIRNIASYAYTAIINNYAGNTKKDSDTATEAYIKKERQVPVDEVLRNAHAQVEEHKKKIELAIRAHLKDKHAKEVVQTYILDNAGELTMHVLHKNINVETVTIDELLSNPSIYQIISSYMLDNKIIQVESLDNFLQTNCWKIDQLDLLNNALI